MKTTMVNAKSFIMDHVVDIPGLGSGVPCTADWNCLKESKAFNAIRAMINANRNGGVQGQEISPGAWKALKAQFESYR